MLFFLFCFSIGHLLPLLSPLQASERFLSSLFGIPRVIWQRLHWYHLTPLSIRQFQFVTYARRALACAKEMAQDIAKSALGPALPAGGGGGGTHAHAGTPMRNHPHPQLHTHPRPHARPHAHAHPHAGTHTRTHTHMPRHMPTHTRTQTDTHAHTDRHTHTHRHTELNTWHGSQPCPERLSESGLFDR